MDFFSRLFKKPDNDPGVTHPLFGALKREGSLWQGRVPFRPLAGCWIHVSMDWGGEVYYGTRPDDLGEAAPLLVHDRRGAGPSAAQEAAFRWVTADPNRVARTVLQALLPAVQECVRQGREAATEPDTRRAFDEAVARYRLDTVDGIREQVELTGISLLEQERDGFAYVVFEFNCGWDEEHGASVLLHEGRVLAASIGGDFANRGTSENLEEHARIVRENSL